MIVIFVKEGESMNSREDYLIKEKEGLADIKTVFSIFEETIREMGGFNYSNSYENGIGRSSA